MAVAIRAITRLQDADDVNVSLGAGVDECALSWDNDTAKFVLRAVAGGGVTDHGALTGLTPDDDHTQYALLAGRAGGQTLYGGTAENDDIIIEPTSHATKTTSYVSLAPSGGRVGIGGTNADPTLYVNAFDVTKNVAHFRSSGTALLLLDCGATGNAAEFGFGFGGTRKWHMGRNGSNNFIFSESGVADRFAILSSTGYVGFGTTAPTTRLHALLVSSVTNAVTNVLTVGHDTSGTAAAGFGAGAVLQLESSTTAAQDAARIKALWYEATHASRKADLVLTAYDTAEREGLRIRGAGSAPAIGFYGVTPIERATLATGAGASVDDVITALQNLGLVKQS